MQFLYTYPCYIIMKYSNRNSFIYQLLLFFFSSRARSMGIRPRDSTLMTSRERLKVCLIVIGWGDVAWIYMSRKAICKALCSRKYFQGNCNKYYSKPQIISPYDLFQCSLTSKTDTLNGILNSKNGTSDVSGIVGKIEEGIKKGIKTAVDAGKKAGEEFQGELKNEG